jgi:hypothetical protein
MSCRVPLNDPERSFLGEKQSEDGSARVPKPREQALELEGQVAKAFLWQVDIKFLWGFRGWDSSSAAPLLPSI